MLYGSMSSPQKYNMLLDIKSLKIDAFPGKTGFFPEFSFIDPEAGCHAERPP
jgi:hypothetical protein